MTREEIFAIWAPSDSIWSDWVKPVLFAHMPDRSLDVTASLSIEPFSDPMDWTWTARRDCCVVVDLPGVESIRLGLQLAQVGCIPIPLFNAAPGPQPGPFISTASPTVDIWPILLTLRAATPIRQDIQLPIDARPAFLLDSARRFGVLSPMPGRFDNRSISFPTDFPSANLLLHHGINTAILIQRSSPLPQADLSHTLLRWYQAGMEIDALQIDGQPPRPCYIPTPSLFRSLVQRLVDAWPLKQHPLGGFGGMISESGAG